MKFIRLILIALSMSMAFSTLAQAGGTSNMEILRDKVKADRKMVVAANMQLNDAEGQAFWPVYENYQGDLMRINAQLGHVIRDYADAYKNGPISDSVAKDLMSRALDVEEAEINLKRLYMPRIEKTLGAAKAARYLQIENKIRAAIKYELADGIPFVR